MIFQDHPRLRGEQPGVGIALRYTQGSPPPTRGTDDLASEAQKNARITPAYAGNSFDNYVTFYLFQDHPRLRGEQNFVLTIRSPIIGSPPPTRGTVHRKIALCFSLRITPAYAGNSTHAVEVVRVYQDHPRLRGEQCYTISGRKIHVGSPPPTRGTAYSRLYSSSVIRITPAYAGNRDVSNLQRKRC